MKAKAEAIKSTHRSFIAYAYESNEFEHPFHFHHEAEIVFIKKGEGDVIIGNSSTSYQSGDVFLIGSNVPHRFRTYSDNHYLRSDILQFSYDCFGEFFFDTPELTRISKLINQSKYGLIIRSAPDLLFTKIEELINLEGISAVISLLQLLSEIDRNQEIEIISKTPDKYSEVKIEMKISAAVDWIDSNYFRKISLDDVASKTNMNKHAFCRAFKHETGKTPMHYINEKRIEEAANLLLKTHKSITEIGFEVGFTNVSSFNRNFKTIRNTSPKAYREMTRVFSS